jgi:hypothetical protein
VALSLARRAAPPRISRVGGNPDVTPGLHVALRFSALRRVGHASRDFARSPRGGTS